MIKKSELCYQHGRVLYSTLSIYNQNDCNNINIVDIGPHVDFLPLFYHVLYDSNHLGSITTIDPPPHRKDIVELH